MRRAAERAFGKAKRIAPDKKLRDDQAVN